MNQAAADLLKRDMIILDTETSALGEEAEILQIAVVAPSGVVLLKTYIKPSAPIDEQGKAFEIHKISNEMVKDAPSFAEVWKILLPLLDGKLVIAYNSAFDYEQVRQEWARLPEPKEWPRGSDWFCAMKLYSAHAKVPGRFGFKWLKLEDACRREGVPVGQTHDGAEDCLLTLALLRAIGTPEVPELVMELVR